MGSTLCLSNTTFSQLSTLFHTVYSIDINNYFHNTFTTIYYKEA